MSIVGQFIKNTRILLAMLFAERRPNEDLVLYFYSGENMSLENQDELRALIQEEIWKAFNTALSAAEQLPLQPWQLNDTQVQERSRIQKEAVQEIRKAVMSQLNKLKAEAQAKVIEKTDPGRAERIRALGDPSF